MSKRMIGAVLALGVTACGGTPGDRLEKMVQWKVDDALDVVDATTPQKERVEQLTKTLISDAKPIITQGLETREALVTEWKSAAPDSAKVHQLVDAQLDAIRGFAHRLADSAIEVHALLTPEQRAKATKRIEDHHSKARRSR